MGSGVLLTGVVEIPTYPILRAMAYTTGIWATAQPVTRKYKPEQLRPIIFYGEQLVLTKQVKYLGVILDSKLNWKEHVDAKCKKALAAFYQLRRVARKTWGLGNLSQSNTLDFHCSATPSAVSCSCYLWTCTQYITVRKQTRTPSKVGMPSA